MSLIRNKKVSLLICFYERPTFLPLMIHNIKNQTFIHKYPQQLELIIADDSISSLKLDIDTLRSSLKGIVDDITYLTPDEKLTIGQKRNLLCKTAKYPVLIFMDDDDYYFPTYIEYSVTELYKRRKVLVGSNSMLFCYVNEDFKKMSINCISPRQIHEATMCMLKSHWENVGGFCDKGNGEGAGLIDGHEKKVNAKLDISKIMVCVCHPKNTCNKHMFLNLASPADYPFSDELRTIIKNCIHNPIYNSRSRFCFKYASRSRPEQFKKCLDTYIEYLSGSHDYNFVVSMDSDDDTMNNDDIKTYLNNIRKKYQLEYYYGESKNKIEAINRDLVAPTYDVLVLISDDMIPQVKGFDQIIIDHFTETFPDYDGMLNFNDGLRNDWPELCTLTVYGFRYYRRFGYIYHPDYTSVYCDQEQTRVGRLLNKIKDVDRVIIKHCWLDFNDELRKVTENPEIYKKDFEVFQRRIQNNFDLTLSLNPETQVPRAQEVQQGQEIVQKTQPPPSSVNPFVSSSSPTTLLSIVLLSTSLQRLVEKQRQITTTNLPVEVIAHCSSSPDIYNLSYLHRLAHTCKGMFVTFMFENEDIDDDYFKELLPCLSSSSTDIVTFKQKCTMDNWEHSFVVNSKYEHINEQITMSGPWQSEYKRNICNWTVFNTSLWTSTPFIQNNELLMENIITKIRSPLYIDKVLYKYKM